MPVDPRFAAPTGGADVADALGGVRAEDWIRVGLILLTAIVLSRIVEQIAVRLVHGDEGTTAIARFVGRGVGFAVLLAGFIYALNALDVRLGPLLGALGIGGLALAFAAQSILENLFSSILLQARRPFRVGDQVSVADHIVGVVEDVNFRVVVVRTFDGERVFVPASQVLQNPIVNVTVRGPWRTTLAVGVAYGTEVDRARELVLEATGTIADVLASPPPEVWFEAFGESSLDLAIRFWHSPDMASRWRVRSEVGVAVNRALAEAEIEIPFPQRTVWLATGEATAPPSA